jgi:3'-5' exoribonuclease
MKRFIRELKEKDHATAVFLVHEKMTGKDRNGKVFLNMTVGDSSGTINARMFEKADAAVEAFEVGDPVWIKGFVQLFQNRRQLIVNEIRKASDGEFVMSDLVAQLGGDPTKLLAELIEWSSGLENEFIRRLLVETLNDPGVREILLKAPAAKTIHHAYRGGLVEHIHSIAEIMKVMASHYKFLHYDLLLFGAIYHDLGKVSELDISEGIHYTDTGRLVGHMAIACEMIDQRTAKIEGFPPELKDALKHIVLSHHGKLEYGSPKLPMFPEAIIVNMIDDLDSKMNTLFHFLKSEVESVPDGEKWTHFHQGFDRTFYLEFFRQKLKS